MSVLVLAVGETVDLLIRFGSQTRLKCAACTKYMKPPGVMGDPVRCGACGVSYINTGPASWVVEGVAR